MGSEWDDAAHGGPAEQHNQEQWQHDQGPNSPGGSGPGPRAESWPGQGGSDTVEFSSPVAPPAPRRTRRVIIAAGAAVAVVAIAAIALATQSGSPGKSAQLTPAQALTAAVHKAASINSLSATYSEQIGSIGRMSGTVQEVRKPLQVSMTMAEHVAGHSIGISGVITSTAMYLKLGGVPGEPKAFAGKWLKISLTTGPASSFGSLIQAMENENPTSQTQMLAAAQHIRADGTAVVNGVPTSKYTGHFAPSAALKLLPAKFRSALAPAMKQVAGDISFTIWIDSGHMVRKMVEVETVASQTLTISFTYLSINQPVTITVPSPSQVMHLPSSALGGA